MVTGWRAGEASLRAPLGKGAAGSVDGKAAKISEVLLGGTPRVGRTREGVRTGGCTPVWRVRFREAATAFLCLGGEDPWPGVFLAFAAF
jgi:hypothetical protein